MKTGHWLFIVTLDFWPSPLADNNGFKIRLYNLFLKCLQLSLFLIPIVISLPEFVHTEYSLVLNPQLQLFEIDQT